MFGNSNQVDNFIHEACLSCHECIARDEVENGKKRQYWYQKADLIMKKDMGNKEIMREKEDMKIGSPQ